jgi:hypothetical protein
MAALSMLTKVQNGRQHFGHFHGNGGHFENSESSLHIYS